MGEDTNLVPKEEPITDKPDACDPHEHEAKRDERKLRHWVVRVLVGSFAFVFVATVLTVLYAFVFRGYSLENSVIGNFLTTLTEILKFVFTPIEGTT